MDPQIKSKQRLSTRAFRDKKTAPQPVEESNVLSAPSTDKSSESAVILLSSPNDPKHFKRVLLRTGKLVGTSEFLVDVAKDGSVSNIRMTKGEWVDTNGLPQIDDAKEAISKMRYGVFLGANGKPVKKADQKIVVEFRQSE